MRPGTRTKENMTELATFHGIKSTGIAGLQTRRFEWEMGIWVWGEYKTCAMVRKEITEGGFGHDGASGLAMRGGRRLMCFCFGIRELKHTLFVLSK